MFPILLMAALGLAADEPCYGHTHEQRVDSEHFWVEWPEGRFDADLAEKVAASAEESRAVMVEELGWPIADEPIVYEIIVEDGSGMGGFARTRPCASGQVPYIELTIRAWTDQRAHAVTAHELGHAVQYAYMGHYLDSTTSWLWWMEGTASWLEAQVTGDVADWGVTADGYLDHADLALHHGASAFLFADTSRHVYGTAVLARYLEETQGPDAVRDLWAWGAESSGEAIWFPDAIEGIGLDWADTWTEWMARAPTVALGWGDATGGGPVPVAEPAALPATGDVDEGPEGLGLQVVRLPPLERGESVEVTVEGDDEVSWHAVLAATEGEAPGSPLLAWVPLEAGSGWLHGRDGAAILWLVVSPESDAAEPHPWSWEARVIEAEAPMPGTRVLVEHESPAACGCSTGSRGGWAAWGVLALLAYRRRRTPSSASRSTSGANPDRGAD